MIAEVTRIIELTMTSSLKDATDRRLAKKKVAVVNMKACEDSMGKCAKTTKELDVIKKGSTKSTPHWRIRSLVWMTMSIMSNKATIIKEDMRVIMDTTPTIRVIPNNYLWRKVL